MMQAAQVMQRNDSGRTGGQRHGWYAESRYSTADQAAAQGAEAINIVNANQH